MRRIAAGTARGFPRFERMFCDRTVWLAFNEGSGSNDAAAHRALEAAFAEAQCKLHRKLCFPREEAPDRAALEAANVDILIVFAGDGTINSIVKGLPGWDGAVLVLPGGTMNLLSGRLHGGDADAAQIITRVAQGKARRVRPATIRSQHGAGLTGMLAGPGTSWNEVREAMREVDVAGVVTTTREAIAESTTGPAVICREPQAGRNEGYAAIMLTPHPEGIELNGFYADGVADYVKQGLALLRRNFRYGPNDAIGTFPELVLASTSGETIGLLIDGEPVEEAGAQERFVVEQAQVEFLATAETSEP